MPNGEDKKYNHDTCKEIIEVRIEVKNLKEKIEEFGIDRRSQDMAIKHVESIINDIRNTYQLIEKDVKNLNNKEYERNKVSSTRNWALWMIVIMTIINIGMLILKEFL